VKKYFCALGLLLSVNTITFAQYGQPKVGADEKIREERYPQKLAPGRAEFIGFRNPGSDDLKWLPSVGQVSDNEGEDNELLVKIKAAKTELKFRQLGQNQQQEVAAKTTSFVAPTVDTNFGGVSNGGVYTPLDNTIAISNAGIIVAIVNSKIGYYTTAGTLTFSKDLPNLINDATLSTDMCDPKVIYDNVRDRFVTYTQVCDKIAFHSYIIMGFSKTNNPTGGWYFYKLPGDPNRDSSFFDYPKMGMSTDDIFVTGNLFYLSGAGGPSSTTTFNQSVIYQLEKNPFYSGNTTATDSVHLYTGLSGAFTITPASYGLSGSYGPGIFLVCSEGITTGSGNYILFNITNKFASHAATIVSYNVTAPLLYSTPGNAPQMGTTHPLNTGDCRTMDAFYLHGNVHFVHHTDIGSGYSGIDYVRIKVAGATATASRFGVSGTDRTYPALTALTNDSLDKSVLIAFNESSSSYYPRTSVVACGNIFTWSAPVVVKAGTGNVNYHIAGSTSDRWGDYTGMCRRYNANPAVSWMAGMYGNATNTWNQHIAKIYGKTDLAVAIPVAENIKISVFPNPVYENCSVKFTITERMNIKLAIVDMQGKLVKELEGGLADEGENVFSFNKANLSDGTYLLNIYGNLTLISTEKIIIGSK
jgi:hypothetical protein